MGALPSYSTALSGSVNKKENNMATKKAPAPKKEPAKKAPAKKPKK